MNRINETLKRKNKNILSVFYTAGYPSLTDTLPLAEILQANGVDMLEIGIPYSDPLADGPVIQETSHKALNNGMSVNVLFKQLEQVRKSITIPVILMGYLNSMLQFGVEAFLARAAAVEIDGIILPDLPPEVYDKEYKTFFVKYNIEIIFLVTTETTEERLHYIDSMSNSFIYLVSSAGITGHKAAFNSLKLKNTIEKLSHPVLIGFGISDKYSFRKACEAGNGAIIGTAFLKFLATGNYETTIPQFIIGIRS